MVVAIGAEELARPISQSPGEVFPITFVLDDHLGTRRRGTEGATDMMTCALAFNYMHLGFNAITGAKRVARILLGWPFGNPNLSVSTNCSLPSPIALIGSGLTHSHHNTSGVLASIQAASSQCDLGICCA